MRYRAMVLTLFRKLLLLTAQPVTERGFSQDDRLCPFWASGDQSDLGADLFRQEVHISARFGGQGTDLSRA